MSTDNPKKAQAFSLNPPRGTHDLLPSDLPLWQHLEDTARLVFERCRYREIRTPVFEHTDLFKRGVGEATDIVTKEMYTFSDKSDRSLTLRPEGTAGVVRAYLDGGLTRVSPPVKLWYIGPMFRYERAQAGRQRQFHQIGIEVFGSEGPLIDAEVIGVAINYFELLGLEDIAVELNSIGCSVCRPAYREVLKTFFAPRLDSVCGDCRDRFERNPLRMLDCKVETCKQQFAGAPASLDHLCKECQEHWDGLLSLLETLGLTYVINRKLVRGLDYYTRTVMEIVSRSPKLGSQATICAGGRYDNLVETLGGPPTPAVGWALGLERLALILGEKEPFTPLAFLVSDNPTIALSLASDLRAAGVSCDLDFPARGLKMRNIGKQLEQANKSGAAWAAIVGAEEALASEVTVKNMQDGSQTRIPRQDLVNFLKSKAACIHSGSTAPPP